jgi:hypothetical protein
MKRVTVKGKIGVDRVLRIELPFESELSEREVEITIQVMPKPMSDQEWAAYIQATAGSIDDPTFMRHPQCMRCNDKGTGAS